MKYKEIMLMSKRSSIRFPEILQFTIKLANTTKTKITYRFEMVIISRIMIDIILNMTNIQMLVVNTPDQEPISMGKDTLLFPIETQNNIQIIELCITINMESIIIMDLTYLNKTPLSPIKTRLKFFQLAMMEDLYKKIILITK